MNDLFDQQAILLAYDQILPLAKHYQSILQNHLEALVCCDEVIDLACGTGIATIKFLGSGKSVTAVDISVASLKILKKKADDLNYHKKLKIINADTTNLNMINDCQYDGASSMIAAHLIPNFDLHIHESFRVIKPGGIFVITARVNGGNQELLVESTRKSLIDLNKYQNLSKEFDILAKSLLMTATKRSCSLKSEKEAVAILKGYGFSNIKSIPNKTLGVMYTLVAQKPTSSS